MPKMVRNRSALHDVLAQGASNRDITVDSEKTVLLWNKVWNNAVFWRVNYKS